MKSTLAETLAGRFTSISPPVVPNFQIADLPGGTLSAVMGILAALVDAQRSGEGRYVDVVMTDCTLAYYVVPFTRVTTEGGARPWRAQPRDPGGDRS